MPTACCNFAEAQLPLIAMPRLEADLNSLRSALQSERQSRTAATLSAAGLKAILEAARERSVQTAAFSNGMKAAVARRVTTGRDQARFDDAESRGHVRPRHKAAAV